MLTDIDAVCFDAFGTVVDIIDKRRPYVALLKLLSGAQRLALKGRLMREPLSVEDCLAAVGADSKTFNVSSILADLKTEIDSITLRPKTRDVWAVLREREVKIAICSNLALPYGAPLLNLLPDAPDVAVMSYETGHIKPEPEIYQLVVDGLNIEPSRILFTGDTQKADVDGPRAFGMKSMLIEDFENLFG